MIIYLVLAQWEVQLQTLDYNQIIFILNKLLENQKNWVIGESSVQVKNILLQVQYQNVIQWYNLLKSFLFLLQTTNVAFISLFCFTCIQNIIRNSCLIPFIKIIFCPWYPFRTLIEVLIEIRMFFDTQLNWRPVPEINI